MTPQVQLLPASFPSPLAEHRHWRRDALHVVVGVSQRFILGNVDEPASVLFGIDRQMIYVPPTQWNIHAACPEIFLTILLDRKPSPIIAVRECPATKT